MVSDDADPVLAVVGALSGSRVAELVGRYEHGAGGTSLVRLDGRMVVLKAWRRDAGVFDIAGSLARMQSMRRRGVPIPELLEHGDAAGCAYLAYEELDGEWPARVTGAVLDDLLAVVDAERGVADAPCRAWRDELERMVTDGDASFDIELGGKASVSVRDRLWREVRSRVPADALGTYAAIYAVRYASWAIASEMEADVLALGTRLVDQTASC